MAEKDGGRENKALDNSCAFDAITIMVYVVAAAAVAAAAVAALEGKAVMSISFQYPAPCIMRQ